MNLPLGRETDYPDKYAPEVLCPISRRETRIPLGLEGELPFTGVDIWNAWELTWLGPGDLPRVATAEIHVPADSPNLVESKSLKLYLNSFAMSSFASETVVAETIARDLAPCVGAPAKVSVLPVSGTEARQAARLAGARKRTSIDCRGRCPGISGTTVGRSNRLIQDCPASGWSLR